MESTPEAGQYTRLPRMAPMAHLVGKTHFVDKQSLDRVNSIIMLSVIGSGLAACVIGAAIYDIGRMLTVW
jgi:hypothetical protein